MALVDETNWLWLKTCGAAVSRYLRLFLLRRPTKNFRHPIGDLLRLGCGIGVVVMPTTAPDHDVVEVYRPFVGTEMFDSVASELRRKDAAVFIRRGVDQRFVCCAARGKF